MNRIFSKRMIGISLILVLLFSTASCSSVRYEAEINSYANDCFSEDFLMENITRGSYYRNPDYIENSSDYMEKYLVAGDDVPIDRTFIITSEDEFNTVCPHYGKSVDFTKEMVIVYIFSDEYGCRDYRIKTITESNQKLHITLQLERRLPGLADCMEPSQRCILIQMKKIDIAEAQFTINY